MPVKLIADSGATKCEWCLVNNGKKKTIFTMGISPYFLNQEQIVDLLNKDLLPKLKNAPVEEVHFYGTGLSNPNNVVIITKALKSLFKGAKVLVNTDMLAAARALCGNEKGMACILGTGSNSCFYNGKKITKIRPGVGYVLGDEGSGAYLGKRVIQYFLYDTFDEDLKSRFDARFVTNSVEILENVYKKPLPNRYLASFAIFLAENRGHYMVENIIEDGLNDFFYHHLYKFRESWTHPLHFIGSIAFGFKDVLQDLCSAYELELGRVLQKPMDGLVKFHA
ncbi:MAG TPA: N-acetylglucosamine kinase [Segetibacter sp.]|jgi:N-acetylglucosamine kinase-like BadF-type ATPase